MQRIRTSACDPLRKMQTTLEATERGEEDESYRGANGRRSQQQNHEKSTFVDALTTCFVQYSL